jgi:hypothetical protein
MIGATEANKRMNVRLAQVPAELRAPLRRRDNQGIQTDTQARRANPVAFSEGPLAARLRAADARRMVVSSPWRAYGEDGFQC